MSDQFRDVLKHLSTNNFDLSKLSLLTGELTRETGKDGLHRGADTEDVSEATEAFLEVLFDDLHKGLSPEVSYQNAKQSFIDHLPGLPSEQTNGILGKLARGEAVEGSEAANALLEDRLKDGKPVDEATLTAQQAIEAQLAALAQQDSGSTADALATALGTGENSGEILQKLFRESVGGGQEPSPEVFQTFINGLQDGMSNGQSFADAIASASSQASQAASALAGEQAAMANNKLLQALASGKGADEVIAGLSGGNGAEQGLAEAMQGAMEQGLSPAAAAKSAIAVSAAAAEAEATAGDNPMSALASGQGAESLSPDVQAAVETGLQNGASLADAVAAANQTQQAEATAASSEAAASGDPALALAQGGEAAQSLPGEQAMAAVAAGQAPQDAIAQVTAAQNAQQQAESQAQQAEAAQAQQVATRSVAEEGTPPPEPTGEPAEESAEPSPEATPPAAKVVVAKVEPEPEAKTPDTEEQPASKPEPAPEPPAPEVEVTEVAPEEVAPEPEVVKTETPDPPSPEPEVARETRAPEVAETAPEPETAETKTPEPEAVPEAKVAEVAPEPEAEAPAVETLPAKKAEPEPAPETVKPETRVAEVTPETPPAKETAPETPKTTEPAQAPAQTPAKAPEPAKPETKVAEVKPAPPPDFSSPEPVPNAFDFVQGSLLPSSGIAPDNFSGNSVTSGSRVSTTNDKFLDGDVRVNQDPVSQAGSFDFSEDTVFSGTLSALASDPEGASLAFAVTSGPANGTLSLNGNGSFSYTPDANYNGTDSFGYSASDGAGGTTTNTVSLTIEVVNDAPVVTAASVDGTEDLAISGTLSGLASDIEGDALTFALDTGTPPSHGTVVIQSNGSYTYTPAANYNGADSFVFKVDDGNGGVTSQTLTLAIGAVNDAPVAAAGSFDGTEDVTLTGTLADLASDVDGDSLTFARESDASHGTVVVSSDGSFSYTPVANYNGSDSFTYSVTDPDGLTVTKTVTLAIEAVNDAPVATADSLDATEDAQLSGTLAGLASDLDGDSLSFSLESGASHGTVVVTANGSFTYDPVANYFGADSFSYTVSDGNGGTDTKTITLAVDAVNDAPTDLTVDDTSINETIANGATVGTVTATDPDDSSGFTYSLTDNGGNRFAIDANSGVITIDDQRPDDIGDVEGIVMRLDPSDPATLTQNGIAVSRLDDLSDADNDAFQNTASRQPVLVESALSGGLSALQFDGVDDFLSITDDSTLNTAAHTQRSYFIRIKTSDDIASRQIIFEEGGTVNGTSIYIDNGALYFNHWAGGIGGWNGIRTASATDPVNANGITITVADNVTIEANTEYLLGYVYDGTQQTLEAFLDSVSIGTVAAGSTLPKHSGDIGLGGLNQDTVFHDGADGADTGFNFNGLIGEFGLFNGALTANEMESITDTGTNIFDATDESTIDLVVQVTDPDGASYSETVTITVNSPPVATAGSFDGTEDVQLTGSLASLASDADGDSLTFELGSQAGHGTAVVNSDGTFTYTPDTDYSGTDSFTYKVSDGRGGTDSQTINLEITENIVANSSFEEPGQASGFGLHHESTVPGWSTTDSGNNIEFWADGFLGFNAADGSALIEANAASHTTLTQTIDVTPGEVYDWSFYHRGRAGDDTIQLTVSETASPGNVQDFGNFTTGYADWVQYSSTYTVPAGVTQIDLNFTTISTSTGSAGAGNLLDGVFFGLSNDTPLLSLDADGSGNAPSADFSTVTVNGTAVNITDSDLSLTDSDDTAMNTLTMDVNGIRDGNAEHITIGGTDFALGTDASATVSAGSTSFTVGYDSSTSLFTVTNSAGGDMANADVLSLLGNTTYSNSSGANITDAYRTIDIIINDGTADSNEVTAIIQVGDGTDLLSQLASNNTNYSTLSGDGLKKLLIDDPLAGTFSSATTDSDGILIDTSGDDSGGSGDVA